MLTFGAAMTAIGPALAVVNERGELVRLTFSREALGHGPSPDAAACQPVFDQLAEYFEGSRRVFELPLALAGSDFDRRIWAELLAIPFGVTRSYGDLAEHLGVAQGARAVGKACGANPIAIVVPCHRVIGKDGSLIGYGGGLAMKRRLLEFEMGFVPLGGFRDEQVVHFAGSDAICPK
jgi:methylated-DNA-[protein]-cysteine S-methyltransferase